MSDSDGDVRPIPDSADHEPASVHPKDHEPDSAYPPDHEPDPPADDAHAPRLRRIPWVNIVLFFATIVSTFYVGSQGGPWYAGWTFAVPLMLILLCHELGHYIAARIHNVDASLPFFIPLPFLFGTLGAIIRMRGRIKQRNALMDIGASGPLAGMAVALPVLIYGVATSEVAAQQPGPWLLEGHSLLYKILLFTFHGPIPEGHDIFLSSTALAGWVGLFVTMLNLLPIWQLDGGHVAYALFGQKQDSYSAWVLCLLPLLGLSVCGYYGFQGVAAGLQGWDLFAECTVGLNWLVWAGLLALMRHLTGKKHPKVDPGTLSTGRRVVGYLCLALFILIFMPVPMRTVLIPEAG